MAKKNLSEQVYRTLKEDIISLKYPPGSGLRELTLAKALGVSRTPVREAFQKLHHEGWIRFEGKKIEVRPVTRADIDEIFEIRTLLESFAFRSVVTKGRPRVAAGAADAVLEQMAQTDHDRLAFTRLDLQFHARIIESADHGRASRFWLGVQEEAVRLGLMAMQDRHRLGEVIEEHRAIVEALWEKDEQTLMQALTRHLVNTRKALTSKFGEDLHPDAVIEPLGLPENAY